MSPFSSRDYIVSGMGLSPNRIMIKHFRAVLVALVATVATRPAQGQSVASRAPTAVDRDLLTALVAVEDSRDTATSNDVRRRGLASANQFIRAFTVRGLGRIERASLIPIIQPSLGDSAAEVRMAAADALAQAATHGGVDGARLALTARLGVEGDAGVRAALLEAVGRLLQGSADQVTATANLISPSLSARSLNERSGAIRGIFFLSRRPESRVAGVIPATVTDRLLAMLTEPPSLGYAVADRVNLATALVNSAAMSDPRLLTLFGDRDPFVRDKVVGALTRARDTATVRAIVTRAMHDPAPIVRFRSVGIYARRLRATDGCVPLVRLARDADRTVAIASVDALSGCKTDSAPVARFLDSLSGSFRNGDAWHLSAHAFVALATVDARRAHAMMPIFAQAQSGFVRAYADTAALLMKDTVALYRLARDSEPNVRTSALVGLSQLVAHAADSIYVAALESNDNQLLMTASAALKGSTRQGVADAVGQAASRLLNAQPRRQTALDGFKALTVLQTSMVGTRADLTPFTVATPPPPTPTFADLAAIERTIATIEMADGAIITFRFHPFDAPTNAARFVRLARAGSFNGLTFHRVAPFFVVQGPSPNANEFSAPDGPFTRDELGVRNAAGTIGLSTRGRDTGDGQIYVNTVDNTWLDHEYTVMGTIVSGGAAFGRMQEGARITRITVALSTARPSR